MLHVKYVMGTVSTAGYMGEGPRGKGTGLLIWSQTPRVIARLAAGSVKGKTQHKANEKNVNIAAPVADYGLCLS